MTDNGTGNVGFYILPLVRSAHYRVTQIKNFGFLLFYRFDKICYYSDLFCRTYKTCDDGRHSIKDLQVCDTLQDGCKQIFGNLTTANGGVAQVIGIQYSGYGYHIITAHLQNK